MAYSVPYAENVLFTKLKILVSELVDGESCEDFHGVKDMIDEYYDERAITSMEYEQLNHLLEGFI